ncbi:MAG: molybdenum cofactor biosynthesis protein MoaE [Pseudomonadota bacterium]
MDIRVQEAAFDPGALLSEFTARQRGAGAVVSFTGLTRDLGGTLETMEIEHYPGMTEKALAALADEARSRWSLEDVLVLHRHGHLRAGEPIMMVATAALHRKPAFEAADFLMDYLKSRAPFWKKEITRDAATWVDAKDTDEAALSQWTR